MTDDELRMKAEAWIESVEMVNGLLEDAGVGPLEDGAAFARRLLDLLPPPDDGEPVTAEWLKAVGADHLEDSGEWVILFNDLNVAVTLTQQDRCWSLELGHGDFSSGNWPHDIVCREQLRHICRALGIPLTEPSPCPTPSQSSGTAPATGCGATGPDTANC